MPIPLEERKITQEVKEVKDFFAKKNSTFCPKSIYLSAKKYILFLFKDISFVSHSYMNETPKIYLSNLKDILNESGKLVNIIVSYEKI